MKYFFEHSESIPDGLGFSHFGPTHFVWIALFIIIAAAGALLYRRADARRRRALRIAVASLIVLDELVKTVFLISFGFWTVNYLPLHLCSINIFLIVFHVVRPCKTLDNFLYAICIPAALLALLFPTWTKLPPANIMHLHSFTVHILLALYPIMLTAGGDIRPSVKYVPKCILLLLGLALPVWGINVLLDTNFMFLMRADQGNPLLIFEDIFGSHLIGFPILLPLVLAVMYLPPTVVRQIAKRRTKA